MMFSPKALRFMIEAVEHRISWYDDALKREGLGEDEEAELRNDRAYLHSILEGLRATEKEKRESAQQAPG